MKCRGLFISKIEYFIRSKIDPQVLVKLYYHLDGKLEPMLRSDIRISKKLQMLCLLPKCSLVVYCSADNYTPSEVSVRRISNESEWTSICNQLKSMLVSSSLQHLDIWLPKCILHGDQTRTLKSSQRLIHGDGFPGSLRQYQANIWKTWVSNQQNIRALGSIKLMVWNNQERPSKQRIPVRALEAEELEQYLDSKLTN